MRARCLAFALLAAPLCPAQHAPEEDVQPSRDVSASGRFALFVNPVLRYGQGAADYRLECDGALVWTARLPYTLRGAKVAADGTTWLLLLVGIYKASIPCAS